MTGTEDEGQSFVVHQDGGAIDAPPDIEPPEVQPQRPSFFRRFRDQIVVGVLLAVLGLGAYGVGAAIYEPDDRLPALVFDSTDPLYGTNAPVRAELDVVQEEFPQADNVAIRASEPVFRVTLPRSVADRLYGKRDESVTIFTGEGSFGASRFLVATAGGQEPIVAIEAPLGLTRSDLPTGVFLVLDPDDAGFSGVVEAVRAAMPEVNRLPVTEVSPEDLYIFGPFQDADVGTLRSRVSANRVTAHIADEIEQAQGDVSLAAPAFLLMPTPDRGTINALYHPARRLIMEPLWGASSTSSLAHEFVHAYLDTAIEDKDELLVRAADYFDQSHPVLHGRVIGDLYRRLDREGRAEETLAFLIGGIAAQQTKTVASDQLLSNQGNIAVSEAILYSDIELLVEYGLLPDCMQPEAEETGAIEFEYYERVDATCDTPAAS